MCVAGLKEPELTLEKPYTRRRDRIRSGELRERSETAQTLVRDALIKRAES